MYHLLEEYTTRHSRNTQFTNMHAVAICGRKDIGIGVVSIVPSMPAGIMYANGVFNQMHDKA